MKSLYKRFTCAALALCLCFLLALPALAQSYAEPGDYDEIKSYTVTVEPRPDGSADITYDIHWQVVGGGSGDYLSWVKIGLANSHADDFRILTPDTISALSYSDDGGSYARVDFYDRYYSPDVAARKGAASSVHFAFAVHQSHLFTRSGDQSASFAFTPGWFDDIVVDELTVRWKTCEGITADNTDAEDGYLVWRCGPLGHGEVVTVNVTVPALTAVGYADSAAMSAEDAPGYEDPADRILMMAALVLVIVAAMVFITVLISASRWQGGFGDADDGYVYYSDGVHVVHLLPHQPPPPGYRAVSRPAGYKPGGGSTRGGGASRRSGGGSHHSSCACACASSCACACACAGGGRAGCSAKNFYRVRLNFKQNKEA